MSAYVSSLHSFNSRKGLSMTIVPLNFMGYNISWDTSGYRLEGVLYEKDTNYNSLKPQ